MMASRRPGPQALGWSGIAGPRDPGIGAEASEEESKLKPGWMAKRAAGPSHQPSRTIPQPNLSSRLPQPSSHRRPSGGLPQQSLAAQPPRSRTSIGSTSGVAVRDAQGPSSSAPTSSRLPTPNLKPRNVLRRKRSGLSQDTSNNRVASQNDSTGTASSESNPRSQTPLDPLDLDRELAQSPMEIRTAQQVEIPMTKAHTVTIYPELDRYRDVKPPRSESPSSNQPSRLATNDLPPPTPLFSGTSSQPSTFSGSPSTRWSESPGPGPYSRDTTPTSISSHSPGLVAPIRIPPSGTRARQADQALSRPPVTRRRAGSLSNETGPVSASDPRGLAVVKELSTSSSSNSTVRAESGAKERKKTKGSSHRPPSPPPRKSSRVFQESRDELGGPPNDTLKAAQPEASSPPAVKSTSSSRPQPVQPGAHSASSIPAPPRRPSRDGTPDLHAHIGQSMPVVHSNLSSASLPERRQSGLLAPGAASRPPLSTSCSDAPNHSATRAQGKEPFPAPRPAVCHDVGSTYKQEPARPARTPSPSVSSTLKTRFPIFGRRTKTHPEPGQQQKKDKPTRKGPAAGTGHEGYGRLGSVRRRSNSVTNVARVIPGTMSSQESLASLSHDRFLRERMAPVIIAGGEVVENRNASSELTRVESNQSSAVRRPSIDSRNGSQVSLSSREAPYKTLAPSPFPRNVAPSPSLGGRRPSESSDSEAVAMKPTIALRRSLQRLKSGEEEAPRLPRPIVTQPHVASPSMASLDASIMSDDSMFDPPAGPAVTAAESPTTTITSGPNKLRRRARSPRKWNLFGRSRGQKPAEKKSERTATVPATVQVVPSKSVAFYAIMDPSEQDDSDPVDLEEVLREARGIAITTPEVPDVEHTGSRRPSASEQVAPNVATLQQPEAQPPAASERAFQVPTTSPVPSKSRPEPAPVQQPALQAQSRPSRLHRVGRIPKVVNARGNQTSPKSFSRPFNRLGAQRPPVTLEPKNGESVAKGPSPPEPSTLEHSRDNPTSANESNFSALIHGIPKLVPPASDQPGQEFLAFSPRKDSQCATTTSSSSSGRLMNYSDATAIVPSPNAPLAEDEIWDEYNDLLGEDTIRLSTFQAPSWPKPLKLDGSAGKKRIEPSLESPTLSPPALPSLVQTLRSGMEHPQSLSINGSEIALEVKRMLDYEPTPKNSMVAADTPSSQDNEAGRSNPMQPRDEAVFTKRDSCSSSRPTRRSNASSSSTQCSEDNSPLSQVNLRVGSMTVSKWLTFGHVLFSPVRDELVSDVGSLKRPSILVIDGLGNDDWSFYAAETYPAATFFNLSPRAPLPAEHRNESSIPLSPPNHHQVQYLSHTAKFPFGAQSFTAVVFRFPAAAPESHYRNIISEARRVLKPGGYIELSILDADLNNMGNRCRRTIRRLKERIHASAPDISLASTSDLILRLIGRRGFVDIKTCRVGVPVASTIARSPVSEASLKRRDSNSVAAAAPERTRTKTKPKKDERSLPEMINDDSPVADESIAQSVAKVGRWWYSRCYESAVAPGIGPSSRGSIWRDKALLAECEEWGTSLKLMVCHARVPDGRARVASI
ncbi:hypothetical protein MYCTH_2301994 [Thermothelomyces thermophilus ATCC 42464]|uniref:Methyltransferase type 11 domain-containing protein n=1 Tax=Thermothelomyces thermophilus (strain ATCC 42464 / BCRC 31852 / DSM 1799) TaxID=573729 RepID=G2QAV3_THET4|nr:uncharacterized protein MYCTH_2301994 [Thermothelomyces thermophilus ATCC 42464]AEO56745.1 hypothetical protein MYCTH_2301994 [Thermothelomyces thermophilus ATCC 42464]